MKVKKLKINNFKGIKTFEVDFKQETTIRGENATGKTTVADSYFWLLRGKNSEQSADFEVQPIGQEELLTSVKIELNFNGENHSLEKTLQNKQRKDGTQEREFIYYIDDVPSRMKDYDAAVAQWFGNNFMLLSDPKYFSTDAIKGKLPAWQERRNLLFSLVREQEEMLFNGMRPDDRKKVIKAQMTKIQSDLDQIPARIDEVSRSIVECDILKAQADIDGINKEMQEFHETKDNPVLKGLIAKRNQLKSELLKLQEQDNIEFCNLTSKLRALEGRRRDSIDLLNKQLFVKFNDENKVYNNIVLNQNKINNHVEKLNNQITWLKNEISVLDNELVELRKQFKLISSDIFVYNGESICSACGQDLPEDKIAELKLFGEQQFNDRKNKKISDIQSVGKSKSLILNEKKQLLATISSELIGLKQQVIELPKQPVLKEVTADTKDIDMAIDNIKLLISQTTKCEYPQDAELNAIENEIVVHSVVKNSEIIARLEKEKEEKLKVFTLHEANVKAKQRIHELKVNQKQLQSDYLKLEKEKFEIEQYIKQKTEKLETTINSYFKFVKFQLFETLQNGEIKECCDVLVNTNGVWAPYSDANHAGRVNSGIDIINCFSNKYNFHIPIFIDFRESVTNIIDTKSQVINLVKDSDYKQLSVVQNDKNI